jgi:hypothetical protein
MTVAQARYMRSLAVNGVLYPEIVRDDAKRIDSPLHNLYDWDVAKAADAWWLERTRELIRQLPYVDGGPIIDHGLYVVPADVYVKDPDVSWQQSGYRQLKDIYTQPVSSRRALMAELKRVRGYLLRARGIADSLGLGGQFLQLLWDVGGLREVANPQVKKGGATTTDDDASANHPRL